MCTPQLDRSEMFTELYREEKRRKEAEVARRIKGVNEKGSPPGSSIHGIFQARVLEWGAIAFSESTHEAVIII